MSIVQVHEKPVPDSLSRNQLRDLIAYKVVEVEGPPTNANFDRRVSGMDLGDVVLVLPAIGGYYGSALFNATKEKMCYPPQTNVEWRGYKFRRARYVKSIQLVYDPDED